MRRIPGAMMAALVLLLPACGSNDASDANADATASGVAGPAGARAGDDSVAAVLQSAGTPLASLRFLMADRPVAGQPFQLQLLASSPQPVAGLQLKVESAGLAITPDSTQLDIQGPDPATRDLTVTAPEQGLTELTVRLSAGEDRAETVYAIPVMVAAAP